jgi:DNA-binding CsgD family transcriptional regulator/PAS domain-containing protein
MEDVSAVIAEIYDTTLDQDSWAVALESITRFVACDFANLFTQNEATKSANAFYSHGIPDEFLETYYAKYVAINPTFPATLFFDVERVIRLEEILPHEEFRRTLFYREWAGPLGWFDAAAAMLDKSAVSCAGFALGRREHRGFFDQPALRRMNALVPHVRRALLIGKMFDSRRVEAAALADTLDGLAAGVLLLDREARIVHANARALELLAEAAVARSVDGKLTLMDAEANLGLSEALGADGGDTDARGGLVFPLSTRSGKRYVAHILSLTSGARRTAGTTYRAVAAVFLSKAVLDLPHPLDALAKAYGLTPAEMRVMFAIVNIGGVPEVAPVLGISEPTVRTHLQRIFDKTGAKRQSDLVKIASGYASPLTS